MMVVGGKIIRADDATDLLREVVETPNPDYEVEILEQTIPFKVEVELIGATAGRMYLRDTKKLTIATVSTVELLMLRDRIDAALEAGGPS